MVDLLKKILRWGFITIFWVFVFSITVRGRTVFNYANEILVQNTIVQLLDEELGDLWAKIQETAKVTFAEISNRNSNDKEL